MSGPAWIEQPLHKNPRFLSSFFLSWFIPQLCDRNYCSYPIENRQENKERSYHYRHNIDSSSIRYHTEIEGEYEYE